ICPLNNATKIAGKLTVGGFGNRLCCHSLNRKRRLLLEWNLVLADCSNSVTFAKVAKLPVEAGVGIEKIAIELDVLSIARETIGRVGEQNLLADVHAGRNGGLGGFDPICFF